MASDISSNISSFANKEGIKLTMLDIIVSLYEDQDIHLSDRCKDFVLERTGDLLEHYDVAAQVEIKRFYFDDDDELSEPYVTIVTLDNVFNEFREKMAEIFLQLVAYDLNSFIEKREDK